MLRRQDVGHRVVVRRIVGLRGDRTLYSDALGELVELTETDLTLSTRSGPLRVPLAEVHRAKRVPPARRPSAEDVVSLELAANEAWPAPVQRQLGGWLLRAADGWTGRGNSALPIGDPDRPLEAAVDEVERWYTARDQVPMINVPLPLAAPVNDVLDARGWGTRPLVLVQTASLAAVLDGAPTREDLPAVTLRPKPSPEWLTIAAGRKGGFPDAARHLLTAVPRVRFAHVYGQNGALLAVARGSVTGGYGHDSASAPVVGAPDGTKAGRWLGLVLIEVVPAARRRGLARHVIGALARWGLAEGATRAFLQVEERNTAAVALYGRLSFSTHHTYLTRLGGPAA